MKIEVNNVLPNAGNDRKFLKDMRTLLAEIKKQINDQKIKDLTLFGHRVDFILDKWQKDMARNAYRISEKFVRGNFDYFDKRFMRELQKAGFTVNFTMSPQVEKVAQACVNENVGLISSLGTEYLQKVQQATWSAVSNGYDLAQLNKELKQIDGISDRRAKTIAINQGAQAHAIIERERRKEAGITQAIWLHSHAGKKPRPSHVKANGKVFDIEKGLYLDGKWVLPGVAVNCRCSSKSVISVDIPN